MLRKLLASTSALALFLAFLALAAPPAVADCNVALGQVECEGVCRVSFLDLAGPAHGNCLGFTVLEPFPVGACDVTLASVECYGLCRVSYLDATGPVHAHCFGVPVLE